MSHLRTSVTLTEADIPAVLALGEAADEHDGVAALSEQTLLRVKHGAAPGARFYLLEDAEAGLAGFGYVENDTGELVVAPERRGHGYGEELLSAMIADHHRLAVWAHGQHPGARALTVRHGMVRVRGLRKLRMRLRDHDGPVRLARPELRDAAADRLEIRAFQPGKDDEAVLEANRRAFVDHPEQGAMTLEDLRQRQQEDWFDPDGFFVAVDRESGRIAGFHWTKVHADGAGLADEPVGEVYVVGVDPAWQGTGLGRALTVEGVRYLRERGLPWALLYVEENNHAAVHLYESVGFSVWTTDVLYSAPGHT
ncbi:mycothiol synthase [Spiractinospora alimapuensis]|uniref:mycothiol synthase n=1 Tax=Spiractinospora alimapuensis TaxID=2820884 RepID=UPI001F3CA6A0|nr:mycothiol synthase [Spiractinospora alimapuensis]QVQ50609.1 mycothiol synthase [Spiractinospora alimapuensis]